MHSSRLWLAGKWIWVTIGTAAATTIVVKCATGSPFSDGYAKWDYNWDR